MTFRTGVRLDVEIRQAARRRLRRIEGQVQGLQRMLGDARDCGEVIQQIAATRAAIDRVALDLIAAGLEQCVRQDLSGKRGQKSALAKLQRAFLMLR